MDDGPKPDDTSKDHILHIYAVLGPLSGGQGFFSGGISPDYQKSDLSSLVFPKTSLCSEANRGDMGPKKSPGGGSYRIGKRLTNNTFKHSYAI